VIEDFEHCYRAVGTKDPRFDGWLFTAVTSTGIYCRPSCPAMAPKREHVRFYPSAAACQQAGFRACKRCRPDASPGSPGWNTRGDVVARAMRLIADGVIDRGGVPALASQLGYSARQLERVLLAEVGASPVALARAQRAQAARILIESSALSMAEVAMAAGFRSIRQFNDTVRHVFALTPTELRRRSARAAGASGAAGPSGAPGFAGHSLRLRLAFRRPLSPDNLFGHLAATAIPGVEEVRDGTYRRTLRLPHGPGIVELTPESGWVACRVMLADLRDLTAAIARCRWLLDLDADPEAVDSQLAEEPKLRVAIGRRPGRRVPRAVDGAEMAIRAVLGQQISTAAARTHGGRLAAEHGEAVEDPGPRGARRRAAGDARGAGADHGRAPGRARLGAARPESGGRSRADARGPRRPARDRSVDPRHHFDARIGRSGRVSDRRPGRPARGRCPRVAGRRAGSERALGAVATLACLCRAVPVGGDGAPDQRLASGGRDHARRARTPGGTAPRTTPKAAQHTHRYLTGHGS